MPDRDKARLTELLHRQHRNTRAPAILGKWDAIGVPVTLLSDKQHKALVAWLRAKWRQPNLTVTDIADHLRAITSDEELVIVTNFWDWDEAVAVLAPAQALPSRESELRRIYPDGFCVANQHLLSALIVDFDDHTQGAAVYVI